jgi:TetR/AcrR family transcriptional repressor of mexJK operon
MSEVLDPGDGPAPRSSGRGRPARPVRPRPGRSQRSGPIRSERSGAGRPPGGSELKRAAIVRAALELFLRDGFERTSMDAIADYAGVSKRTIYNYYEDKRSLFLGVISETYGSMIDTMYAIIDKHLSDVTDPEASLIGFATDGAGMAFRSWERSAMIRLMMTEAPQFPELQGDSMRPQTITGRLAQRLAVMADRGLLDIEDPDEAANHLFALTFGLINNRSLFGIRMVSDDDIRAMVTGGVRAFVRAYRPPA